MVKLPADGVRKATICMIHCPGRIDGRGRAIAARGRNHLVFGDVAVRLMSACAW